MEVVLVAGEVGRSRPAAEWWKVALLNGLNRLIVRDFILVPIRR